MMSAVGAFLGVMGNFASVIGLSMQIYDKVAKDSQDSKDQHLGIYIALTDITKTWKSIHNEYHVISPEVRNLSKQLSDGRGGIKSARQIADDDFIALFKNSTQISQQARGFNNKLEIYFSEPKNKVETNRQTVSESINEIREALGLSVSTSAAKIHSAQLSAMESHLHVCQFFDQLAPLLRKSSWTQEEKDGLLDLFRNLPGDFDSVIVDCDIVLLNVIDLYKYISSDLLGGS